VVLVFLRTLLFQDVHLALTQFLGAVLLTQSLGNRVLTLFQGRQVLTLFQGRLAKVKARSTQPLNNDVLTLLRALKLKAVLRPEKGDQGKSSRRTNCC
jgi:hypothetical protein